MVITGNAERRQGRRDRREQRRRARDHGDRNIVVAGRLGLPYDGGLGNSGNGVSVTGNENQIGGTEHRRPQRDQREQRPRRGDRRQPQPRRGQLRRPRRDGRDRSRQHRRRRPRRRQREPRVAATSSSHNDAGVCVDGTNNTIMANTLGTDAGEDRRARQRTTACASPAASGTSSAATEVEGNFIAGNTESGVQIEGGQNHRVEGNDIGAAALPNDDGVVVRAASTSSTGNLVSGNERRRHQARRRRRRAAAGQQRRRGQRGLRQREGRGRRGRAPERDHRQHVSGNLDEGVLIEAFNLPNADGNWLTGNTITGQRPQRRPDRGRRRELRRRAGSRRQRDQRQRRRRRDRRPPAGQRRRQQLDLRNDDLGIDLDDDGPTANDGLLDPDAGAERAPEPPDHQQPRSWSSCSVPGLFIPKSRISWTLRSAAATDYRLEFYLNDTCAGPRRGQGAARHAAGDHRRHRPRAGLDRLVDPVDEKVTVTATDTDPNGFVLGPTSELSGCG